MTLSIGPATDYLYGLAQQAVVGVTVNGKPMHASDGPPRAPVFGMFVVGVEEPEGAADTTSTRTEAGLGGTRFEDDYTILCYIDVRIPGDTQKTARDAAETAWNNFWALFIADTKLGGALHGGRFAQITNLTETPGLQGTAATKGRSHLIKFAVRCRDLTN